MCELTKGGISQLTSRKSATPVHLIELSIRDMKKMKDNSIIVTSIQRNNGKYNEISTCYYKTVEYGNNIQIERSSIIGVDGKAIEYEDILLSKIKGNYILILALKSEILDSDNNTVIIQNSFNQSDHIKPSGYVLLVYAILDKNNPTKVIWENEHVQICHDSKPNTISDKNQIKSKKLPKFCFNLNENKNVRILYEYQLSFVFSGYYITHHQIPPVNSFHQDYPFINMSSYGNQKLFNHMRASIIRKLNNH